MFRRLSGIRHVTGFVPQIPTGSCQPQAIGVKLLAPWSSGRCNSSQKEQAKPRHTEGGQRAAAKRGRIGMKHARKKVKAEAQKKSAVDLIGSSGGIWNRNRSWSRATSGVFLKLACFLIDSSNFKSA
jgi:hypothetical protein